MPARRDDDTAPGRGADGCEEYAAECGSTLGPEHVQAVSDHGEDLPAILKMLTRSPDARGDLVEDIRAQLNAGEYLTEERLNVAIYRLLKDFLA